MKIIALILAIVLHHDIAIANHIDSLTIQEEASQLSIYGAFPPIPGSVLIDSMPQSILAWSTDKIVCTIADTGRGSAGPVEVLSGNYRTEPRNKTIWQGIVGAFHHERHSRDSHRESGFFFRFRVDLHSALLQRKHIRVPMIAPSFLYIWNYWGTQYHSNYGYEYHEETDAKIGPTFAQEYTSGFKGSVWVDVNSPGISLGASNIRGVVTEISYIQPQVGPITDRHVGTYPDFGASVELDSLFRIRDFVDVDSYYEVVLDVREQRGTVSFLPPMELLGLRLRPVLDTSIEVPSAHQRLIWHSLDGMSSYQCQVALSADFSKIQRDFVSTDTAAIVLLPRGITYYWRVRGLSRFGSSLWSKGGEFNQQLPLAVSDAAPSPAEVWLESGALYWGIDAVGRTLRISDLLGGTLQELKIESPGSTAISSYRGPIFISIDGKRVRPRVRRF